jgi:hypothetical protein
MYCITLTQPLPISRLRIKTLTHKKSPEIIIFISEIFTVSFLFQNTKQGIQAKIFFTLFAWLLLLFLKNITSKEKG